MGGVRRQLSNQGRGIHAKANPAIVKDVPPLRECGRGTDAGTEVEGHARGTRNHRNLNAAINLRNLIMPVGRSRNGRGQEVVVLQQGGLQRPRDRDPGNGGGCAPGVAAGITGS